MALLAAVMLPLAVPSTAVAERWQRPVPGEVARSFSYSRAAPFTGGAHRGVDLAARPGAPVRSACAGTVEHAGPVAEQGRVVSVRCRARRVSYLPLARVTVRAGAAVRAGAPLGTVAAGHGGLHVGVRREADRFAYEDPLALIARPGRPPEPAPTVVRRPRPATRRPVAVRRPTTPRVTAPRPAARAPRPAARPKRPAPAPPVNGLGGVAPLPVWVGLGLLLTGVAGSGTLAVRRRRASRRPLALASGRRGMESPT